MKQRAYNTTLYIVILFKILSIFCICIFFKTTSHRCFTFIINYITF
jgi:hypothetical protein